MSSTCPLCNARKAKRACPALGRQICAVCCGTKRLTEISCPDTCSYLAASKAHPPAVVQRRQERDLQFLLPLFAELTEPQYRLLLLFQGLTLRHAQTAVPALRDVDIADAAGAVASTLETAQKGIIYQHQAPSIPAQRLAGEFEGALRDLAKEAGGTLPPLERDAAAALRQLARAATNAEKALAGDEPPVFLKVLGRIMTKPEAGRRSEDAGPGGDAGTRLVIPG